MPRNSINLMIGGAAGQGLATVSQVLAKALVRGGYHMIMHQSYMSRIRGGHNYMLIRAAWHEVAAPREGVDLVLALNQETVDLHQDELNPEGLVLGDEGLSLLDCPSLAAPLSEMGGKRLANVAGLGVMACLIGLDMELVAGALESQIGAKHADLMPQNREVLEGAYEWAGSAGSGYEPLAPAPAPEERIMIGGNQAIALGALSAGVKFCSFYPMTPSTSIALTLIQHAEAMGLVVEQAEDEIAALNMALGASFAGAPALVPTSGGGFALMAEALSLAGMTETPVVIALIMRPGPATGLPTRTEQGDLEFALYAGHGEFPRAIFAPGDTQECFHLTRDAFRQAEACQTPVIVLGDQYLADSLRSAPPFALEGLEPVGLPELEPDYEEPYQRYQLTHSGVSPRLIPGLSNELVLADSDEHYQTGHITEDSGVRKDMVEKRLGKLELLREALIPPSFTGPEEAQLMLVSWGSSKGPVAEAADMIRDQGVSVATCHFSQVWPLDQSLFKERLGSADRLVVIEGNATGQFARLISKETGLEPDQLVLRYDGEPFTPEYIVASLKQAGSGE